MKAVIQQHVYIWKFGIRQVHERGEPLDPDNVLISSSPNRGDDSLFYVCPIDITIDIPTQEEARLMELAGLEQELNTVRERAMKQMAELETKIAELRCISHEN